MGSFAFTPKSSFFLKTIVVASSLPMTGNLSHIGKGVDSGAQVYFDYINESQGGVYNRQIITKTLDDVLIPKKQFGIPYHLSRAKMLICCFRMLGQNLLNKYYHC